MKKMETDVVVIGTGPSGLASSVQAAMDGARVIALEKANISGGAANMGMGPLGLETKYQQRQMVQVTVEEAFKMLMDYTRCPGDVADPWYTGDFEATWRDVLEGCQALLDIFTPALSLRSETAT